MEVYMANIKSAKKRISIIDEQNLRNKSYKAEIATSAKKYKTAVDNGEDASKILSETVSLIDSAVSKGILHKETANRKKARLSSYKK